MFFHKLCILKYLCKCNNIILQKVKEYYTYKCYYLASEDLHTFFNNKLLCNLIETLRLLVGGLISVLFTIVNLGPDLSSILSQPLYQNTSLECILGSVMNDCH